MNYSENEISLAMLFGTTFSADRFEILAPCYWLEQVQRKTGLPTLFVYRHRKSNKFGLGQWTIKPKVFGQGAAVGTEICLFDGPPGQNPVDLPTMEWLMWRCKPEEEMMEEGKRKTMEARKERYYAVIERKNILDDMEKVLRKQGLDEAAEKLSLDDVPDEGRELDEMRELLRWAGSGKIISTG